MVSGVTAKRELWAWLWIWDGCIITLVTWAAGWSSQRWRIKFHHSTFSLCSLFSAIPAVCLSVCLSVCIWNKVSLLLLCRRVSLSRSAPVLVEPLFLSDHAGLVKHTRSYKQNHQRFLFCFVFSCKLSIWKYLEDMKPRGKHGLKTLEVQFSAAQLCLDSVVASKGTTCPAAFRWIFWFVCTVWALRSWMYGAQRCQLLCKKSSDWLP